MSPHRRAAAALLAVIALGLDVLLVSVQYGLAEEYGAGTGTLVVWAVLPLTAALVAVALTGFRWWATAAGVVLCVVTVPALAWATHLGGAHRDAALAAADADFRCNGENSEVFVPEAVDEAFQDIAHPSPYWLYGPISGSPLGCTAAIHGDHADSFPAWRAALLGSGWTVERDDSEVAVVDHGVRLTLFVEDDLSMLHASSEDADDCGDGRSTSYDDGTVGIC